jgi:hypothetical protein
MRYVVATLLMIFCSLAQAIPVEWTLQNVQFEDGGTAYGTFTYDADANLYSKVDVTTTSGTMFAGFTYDVCHWFVCPQDTSPEYITFGANQEGVPQLERDFQWFFMSFVNPLTNSGGTRQIIIGPCMYSCEQSLGSITDRNVTTGYITAVPVPAAVWLFGSALAGLGWFRRKTA